jgi:replication factor C small subunit
MKQQFQGWVKDQTLPHLLLSGRAGVGKTSLARLLMKMLHIPNGDILFIKASKERRVDDFESKIEGFVQTYPMIDNPTGVKYVILDEADALSELTQKTLRSEIEMYSATVRFILTCNYPQKIIEPIRSRCMEFYFQSLSMEEFLLRSISILEQEEVKIDFDVLEHIVNETYPDMRKCIGQLQKCTIDNKLTACEDSSQNSGEYGEIIALFSAKKINEARRLLSGISQEEYTNIYRFLYEKNTIFGDKQDDALLILRDGLYRDALVADREINLSATLLELSKL